MTYNQSSYIRVRFGIYHFVRRVPADLQQYYRSDRVSMSLRTKSVKAAARAAQSINQRVALNVIENKNVNSLDIVDDNQGLIDYIDYLSEDITVTHTSNMLTYDVVKKYDLIIIQCYNWQDDYTDQVQNDLKTHYSTLLKDNGSIVVPIINKVL